jgi:hypothetical protein
MKHLTVIISLLPLIQKQPQIKEDARSGTGDFTADLDPTTTTWMNSHLPQGQDYALEFLLWIYVIMTAHHLQFWGKELVVTYYCLIFMLPGKEIVFMA